MIARMLDSLVGTFSPAAGLRRASARHALDQINRRGLEAGKKNRWTSPRRAVSEAGDLRNLAEIQDTRRAAWDLYYNNVHARKIVRAIVAQVVGVGLMPESLASAPNGDPIDDFRDAAKLLHGAWGARCDWLGEPGRGGLDLPGIQRQAVRELVLSGEVLVRYRRLTVAEQARRGLPIPLALEVLESERLAETDTIIRPKQAAGNTRIFRGIEYDADGRRVAYHFYKSHPSDPKWWASGATLETVPVPADEILHVYFADRPSQTRGVSWFAPALLEIRDVGDYKENVLAASAVAACFSLVIKTVSGSGLPTLNAAVGDSPTDRDGNPITRVQKGGILNLRPGEDAQGIQPGQPTGNAEGYGQFMLRGAAASFPGVKASTVHGDYRGSSFASEKSADNDTWRETEQAQEEFCALFCTPVWRTMVEAGVMAGWFDRHMDLRGFDVGRYRENRDLYDAVAWAGPVAKSINPLQDENATAQGLRNGTTSVVDAAAGVGFNARELLKKQASLLKYAQSLGLPDGVIAGLFGLSVGPSVSGVGPGPVEVAQATAEAAADNSGQPDASGEPAGPKGVAA